MWMVLRKGKGWTKYERWLKNGLENRNGGRKI